MHLMSALFLATITAATLWTIYTNVVTISSHLHSLLPPWDNAAIAAFPNLQKYYRLFIYILGYMAAGYRSTVYRSISTQDGTQPSLAAVKTLTNGGTNGSSKVG